MNEWPRKSPFSLLSLQHVIVMNDWRGSKRMNAETAPPPGNDPLWKVCRDLMDHP